MATILKTGNFINVTAIAADVEPHEIFGDDNAHPEGRKVKSFQFIGGSDNDKCVLKNGTDALAIIAQLGTPDKDQPDRMLFGDEGQYMNCMVDFSAGTFNTGHILIIELA